MSKKNPILALLLSWLIPGAGHLYIGKKGKAFAFLFALCVTFIIGYALADRRNVFFPADFIRHPTLSTLGQLPMGLMAILIMIKTRISGALSGPDLRLMPLYTIGTLFTCVAGLLNVLVMFNAFREAQKLNKPPNPPRKAPTQ